MQDGWISINDYARKFKVADITVRRRIKQGKIPAELKNGKYYIRADYQEPSTVTEQPSAPQPPPGVVATAHPSFAPPAPSFSVPPIQTPPPAAATPPEVTAADISAHSDLPPNLQGKELLDFCDRYLAELKARELHLTKRHESELSLLEAKLAKKDSEINALKQQIEDLQLLVKILENKI